MEDKKSLATLLGQFMGASEIGDARLASLVNKQVGITGFLHRSTVRNWRNGSSKSVKDWRQLAAIAAALDLDQEDTDQLLFTGGCPPIHTLKKMANEDDQSFLTRWDINDVLKVDPTPESISSEPTEPIPPESILPDALKETEATHQSHLSATQKSPWPRLLRIAVPALAIVGLLFGLSRWRGGVETGDSFTIYSEQVETQWNYTIKSWNGTIQPLETDLAFQGDQVLDVKLDEYGGVSFFHQKPIDPNLYQYLQFYIRRADSSQNDTLLLNILIDDDGFFENGDIGQTTINKYAKEAITADAWQEVKIPLKDFSAQPFTITQLAFQSRGAGRTPHFWVDQIQLVTDTGNTETTKPLNIYTDHTRTDWDFTNMSWDFTAEPLETRLAVEGSHVLNVRLEEYAGLAFFHPEPLNTEPYSFLRFYLRRADSSQNDALSLNILIDDDNNFGNGEVGRTVINNHLEGEFTGEGWHEVEIPLNIFSSETFTISQIVIQSPVNGRTPHFWVDQIQLVTD